jgi:polar amino acid transport system permease protein
MAIQADHERIPLASKEITFGERLEQFPWWLVAILLAIAAMAYQIVTNPPVTAAFQFIIRGLRVTIYTTLVGFALAMILGMLAGLGRVSRNPFIRNFAIAYIEFIRGVPILVLILTIAFVIVPVASESIGFSNSSVPMDARAMVALALIYGAFLAEVFRAGIESVAPGQMEAARSLGMTHFQAMTYIILPQAIRNILPALGNDFVAMLKDSSLVSVLAVRDITQQARIHAGSTFRFRETYLVLTVLYLTMTLVLSLLLQWYQRRLRKDA